MKPATAIRKVGREGIEWLLCDECATEIRAKGYRTYWVERVEPDDHEECERCVDPADFDSSLEQEQGKPGKAGAP